MDTVLSVKKTVGESLVLLNIINLDRINTRISYCFCSRCVMIKKMIIS